jgi:hypothetical protein
MMSYTLVYRKLRIFRVFTGLDIKGFNRLYRMIWDRNKDREIKRFKNGVQYKRIEYGGFEPSILSLPYNVSYILSSLKLVLLLSFPISGNHQTLLASSVCLLL